MSRPTPSDFPSVSLFSLGERIEVRLLTCNSMEKKCRHAHYPIGPRAIKFHLTRIFTVRNSFILLFFTSDSHVISFFFFQEVFCDYMFITYHVCFLFFFLVVRENKKKISKFIYLCSFLEVL